MLNKKQKIAADIYIETGNRELALEKAGYNKKSAYIFDNDKMQEYISKKKEDKNNPTGEIISYLTKVMRGEEADATATQRIKAAEMLSKHYGLDKEKQKEDKTVPVVIYDDIK